MQLARLVTCDGMEARILAARLGAEGIVWSIRGGFDGPLALGAVDLLVDIDDLDAARALLDLPAGEPVEPVPATTFRDVVVIAAVLVVLALFAVVRMGARV